MLWFDCHEVQGKKDSLRRGLVWIHLGLARVSLLAPIAPVDPRSKHAIKLSLLRARLEEVDARLCCLREQVRGTGGSCFL